MQNNIIKIDNPFFRADKQTFTIAPGSTVTEILSRPEIMGKCPGFADKCVAINGNIIPLEKWDTRILQPDEFLYVVPKVASGDDGKQILNVVLMIAIIALAGPAGGYLATGTWGTVAASAGAAATLAAIYATAIIVGGGLLISSLQPHPKKPTSGFIDSEQSQSFGWNPSTLQRQGIAIPRIYGRNLVYGNVCGAYTEKEANSVSFTTVTEVAYYIKQWGVDGGIPVYQSRIQRSEFDPRKVNLQTMVNLGIGPLQEPFIEGTVWLNDQPIENLERAYIKKQYGDLVQTPIPYFNDHQTEVYVGRLVTYGTPVLYTTSNANFHNLEVEVSFPQGLYNATSGDLANNTVNITIEIKKTTDSVWTTLANAVDITDDVGDKVIQSYSTDGVITIEFGQNYDIRVTKNTAERDDIKYGDNLYLDKVREIIEIPFVYGRRSSVGIKVQATDQISGSIRYSGEALGLLVEDYKNETTAGVRPIIYSNNNALVVADVLTQPVYSGSHSPWKDCDLMCYFDGADAATTTIDSSPKAHVITFYGDAQLDTADYKISPSSLYLDNGNNDYALITNGKKSWGIWNNLVEDWTIDVHFKLAQHDATERVISQYVDSNNGWYLGNQDSLGFLLRVYVNGSYMVDLTMTEITDDSWHHAAIVKKGAEVGVYIDGTQEGYALLTTTDGLVFEDAPIYIGQSGASGAYFYGWIDHLRIVKNNIFSANPVDLSATGAVADTITPPTSNWTDPGNSYLAVRYDGFNPSRLHRADLEDLYDWCATAQVNEKNVGIASISLAPQAIVVTTTPHPHVVGDTVLFRGVADQGMVELTDGTTATVVSVADEYTFTIDLDTSAYTAFVATHWLGINGTNKEDVCGEDKNWNLYRALTIEYTGFNGWVHAVDEVHWFVIDLGQIYTVLQVQGRSNSTADPTDVDIYVSEDGVTWGTAVATGISTWQDTSSFVTIDTTNKAGRYVKFVINDTEDASNHITWAPGVTGSIIDVQVLQTSATVEEYEPRFAFNGIFDTDTTMWEAALQICEQCRAVPFFSGTKIRFAIDNAKTPSYAFTMGNMNKDSFREVYIPKADKASEIEVHMRDRIKRYARSPFTLMNADAGDSVHKVQMDLFGVTSNSMAERLASHRLKLNQYVNKKAIWSSDVEAIPCEIGDLVLVQNDVTNYGQIGSGSDGYTGGGRITAVTVTNGWLGVDSSMIVSVCGEDASPNTLAEALDGTGSGGWLHYVTETHQFILDLGETYNITKFKAQSDNTADPTDVDIYVSADGFTWTLVVGTISTWQDNGGTYVEVDAVHMEGRYVKVVINDTESASDFLAWGDISPIQPIFDVYGEQTKITIDGKIDFDSPDWETAGTNAYKLLIKGRTDAAPESKEIIGLIGDNQIVVAGVYTVTPVVGDVWAAGLAEYEALPYLLVDINQNSSQNVDLTGIQYAEEVYTDD